MVLTSQKYLDAQGQDRHEGRSTTVNRKGATEVATQLFGIDFKE